MYFILPKLLEVSYVHFYLFLFDHPVLAPLLIFARRFFLQPSDRIALLAQDIHLLSQPCFNFKPVCSTFDPVPTWIIIIYFVCREMSKFITNRY